MRRRCKVSDGSGIVTEGEGLNGVFVLWKGSGGTSTIASYDSLGRL